MPSSIVDARDEDIYLVTSHAGGMDGGMIVTWITQASMSTTCPRVVGVFSPRNHTTELIEQSGRFVLHQLAEEQLELVPRFGLHSSRTVDKFAGLALVRTRDALPIVSETRGWAECQVAAKIDTGDRIVYLADVVASSPVQTHLRGLRASTTFSRLAPDVVEALASKRAATMERDDELVIASSRLA